MTPGPTTVGGRTPTAVILTALGLEYGAVREHLVGTPTEREERGSLYELADFPGRHVTWRVVTAQTGAGNAPAAVQVERAIHVFSPAAVLFVGVAGGRRDAVLGDVVAANAIYGYEAGESAERGFVSRIKTYQPSFRLVQRAQRVARERGWQRRIKPSCPSPPPGAHVRPLAAGGKVVTHSRSQVARLLDRHCDDALAVEMEGFGFMQAAYVNPAIDSLVIRGISDLLSGKDTASDQEWQPVAARHAAAFAFEVLASVAPAP